jgi:hypothetical protein
VNIVSLDVRALRRAGAPPAASPATVAVRGGCCIILNFGDGTRLELAPDHARAWAERLLANGPRGRAGER